MAHVSSDVAPGRPRHRCPTWALCSQAGTEIFQAVRKSNTSSGRAPWAPKWSAVRVGFPTSERRRDWHPAPVSVRKIDILFPKRLSKTSLTGLRQFLARSHRKIVQLCVGFRHSIDCFSGRHKTQHKTLGGLSGRFYTAYLYYFIPSRHPRGGKTKIGLVELSLTLFGDKQHFGGEQEIERSSAGSPLFIEMLWRKQRDTWLFNEKNFAYTALIGVAKWHLYKQMRSFFNHIKSSNTNVSLFIIASLMNWLNASLLRILMIGRKAIH